MKSRSLVFVLAAVLFALYAAFGEMYGWRGGTYKVYQYFGGLVLDGADPYDPPPVVSNTPETDHRRPQLLDFTGLSLALYTGAVWLNRTTGIDGFHVLNLAWFLVFLGVLWTAERRGVVTQAQTNVALALAVLTPGLAIPMLVTPFEDKVYLLAASAMGLLVAAKRYNLAAALCGWFTGHIGFPAAFLPVILFAAWNDAPDRKRVMARLLLIYGVVALIALSPFFPESLIGWQRRAAVEARAPEWYSLWNLWPGYVPNMNKVVLVAAVAGILFATWRRFITPALAMFLIAAATIIVSSNAYVTRVIPLVIVASLFLTRREERRIYFGAALMYLWGASMIAYAGYPKHDFVRWVGSAFMFSPLFLFFALKLRESGVFRRLRPA